MEWRGDTAEVKRVVARMGMLSPLTAASITPVSLWTSICSRAGTVPRRPLEWHDKAVHMEPGDRPRFTEGKRSRKGRASPISLPKITQPSGNPRHSSSQALLCTVRGQSWGPPPCRERYVPLPQDWALSIMQIHAQPTAQWLPERKRMECL